MWERDGGIMGMASQRGGTVGTALAMGVVVEPTGCYSVPTRIISLRPGYHAMPLFECQIDSKVVYHHTPARFHHTCM